MRVTQRIGKWLLRPRETGQMIIVFALIIAPTTLVIGVVAVDASMWQSERRGAQKDADLAALAGAIQLLDPSASAADARAAATSNKTLNDQQANASFVPTPVVSGGCFPGSGTRFDSVSLNINHATRGFFLDAFRIPVPKPGAHAKACAGSVTSMSDITPLQTDVNAAPCFDSQKPQFGTLCGLEFGSKDDNPRGVIDLQAPGDYCSAASGSGDLESLIEFGAPGHCRISGAPTCDPTHGGPWYECVAVQTGDAKKIVEGVHKRIAREGACDANHDGIESFNEVVRLVYDNADLSKRIYEAIDCDPNTDGTQISPRLITIIVLQNKPDPGPTGYPIVGFAGFYLAGCWVSNDAPPAPIIAGDLDPKCDVPGNALAAPVVSFGGRLASPPYAPDAADCGVGNKPPCPTNTPVPPTSTPTKTPTPTPVSPTPPPTDTPLPNGGGNCGHGNQPTCTPTPVLTSTPFGNTATPTNTPGGPTPTATPNGNGNGGGVGHTIVYGNFVNLIVTNGDIGAFDPTTTYVGVTLVE